MTKHADDNLTLRYYKAEMRYLRDAGREFAEAFPEQAAQLNLDKVGTPDPFVERLFEGFAFLMGRLREKLDDDLPELTEGLVSLLWPHYLRTIPSLSVVEFAPDISRLRRTEHLPKGFEVLTRPIGPHSTRCSYTTTEPVALRPLEVAAVKVSQQRDGRSVLHLRFACDREVDWAQIDLTRIALYLNAEAPLACALHKALTLNCDALYVRLPDAPERRRLDGYFGARGFGADEQLWPKGDAAFSGYQLLLEYFNFREKFMFVTLCGVQDIGLATGTPWFELEVVLNEAWPRDLRLNVENVRLHSVPVINLFALESDPLTTEPLCNEYLLRPLRLQDGHIEIYSVDRVSTSKRGQEQAFVPFTSFRHRGGMLRDDAPERYFHTRLRRSASGLYDTWLILGGDEFDPESSHRRQRLSLSLTGTNGQLPRKALQSTVIDALAHEGPPKLKVRNLCAPSQPCYPPNQDRFHWRVLSHLGSNFLPMLDNAEVLRGTLALYDWSDGELNRRRLQAIVKVRHHLIERFDRGILRRGVDIEVTLDADGFCGEGDICLFGEMLSRFFGLYADIHLFNQLTLILQPSGKRLQWNEKRSQKIPG